MMLINLNIILVKTNKDGRSCASTAEKFACKYFNSLGTYYN